jgi:hypothetical protein
MLAVLATVALIAQAPTPEPVRPAFFLDSEISRIDRDLLRLFPGFTDFENATWFRLPDSSYAVGIRCAGDSVPKRFEVSAAQFNRIRDYVLGYPTVARLWCEGENGWESYRALWLGIGDWAERSPPPTSPGRPTRPSLTNRVIDAISGAACGAGLGTAVGIVAGTKLLETRRDSVYLLYSRYGCSEGGGPPDTGHYWKKWTTDVYRLDPFAVPLGAAAGTLPGAAAGYGLGKLQRRKDHDRPAPMFRRERDLDGLPISENEIHSRMGIEHRALNSALALTGATALGYALAFIASDWAYASAIRNHHADSLEFRGLGNALTIPVVTITLGTALKLTWLGYRIGENQDRNTALAKIRRERFGLEPD